MGFSEVTAPVRRALELEDAKRRLGIDDDPDHPEDEILKGYLDAAIRFVQNDLNRQLVTATLKMTMNRFPPTEIQLERPPFQSLTTFQYIDVDGNTQTVSSALYGTQTDVEPGTIYLLADQSWPDVDDERDVVIINYKAGYGDDPATVPETMKTAIAMFAGHWYANRESVTDERLMPVPQAYEALIWQERNTFVA